MLPPIKKNSGYELSAVLVLFIVFFISDDTLTFGTNINQVFILGKYLIYTIASIVLFVSLNFGKKIALYSEREIAIIILLFASFALTVFYNVDFRTGYFLQLVTLILSILIAKFLDFSKFIQYYQKGLYLLSVISIIVFVLVYLVPGIVAVFPTTVNFGGTEFGNLFICAVFKDMSFLRNTSIFREPGVYMIYLLFGIIIEFFFKGVPNRKYLITYIITLITTFSTSGIAVLGILAIGYMFKVNKFKVYLFVSAFIGIIAVSLVAIPGLSEQFFSKLSADSSDYASTLARLSSFSVPFLIFLNNPLFGAGLSNFVNLYSLYSIQLFGIFIDPESASTNTIVNTFAIFGITYGVLMMYSFLRLSKQLGKLMWPKAVIFVSFLMMFSSQEMRYSLFLNILIMYGLLNRNIFRAS